MVDWHRFVPSNFEYDFEREKLCEHRVAFNKAVECFLSMKRTETRAVEMVRRIRDRQARALARKTPAEIIAYFRQANTWGANEIGCGAE